MAEAILVRDVMTKDVKTVRPDSSVAEAVTKMDKFDIGSIVVAQGKRPLGIITERDILRKIVEPGLDPKTVKARQIMSSPLITVEENVSLEEAARLMARKGIKKLPVVRNEELVGIITSMDVVKHGPSLLDLLGELIWIRRVPRSVEPKTQR